MIDHVATSLVGHVRELWLNGVPYRPTIKH